MTINLCVAESPGRMKGPPVHPSSLSPIAAVPPSYRCMFAHCMCSPSPAPSLLRGWEVNAAKAMASEPDHSVVERVCIVVSLPCRCWREARRLAVQLYALCSIARFSAVPVNLSRVFKSALGAGYCDTRGPCPASLLTRLRRVFTSTDCKSWTPESQPTYCCFHLKD